MTENLPLRLYLADDGIVWYADGHGAPYRSGQSLQEFVGVLRGRSQVYVRTLGDHRNAPLVVALYSHCIRQGGGVEVAGPSVVCESRVERNDPEIALFRMRQCLMPQPLGGWRLVTSGEYPAYALAVQLSRGRFDMHARHILNTHPAWSGLQFIFGISTEAAAFVLSEILDPRWFINPHHPDRMSRLISYLGLRPKIQEGITAGKTPRTAMERRCHTVLRTWQTAPPGDRADPRAFLWRVWAAAGGGAKGDLRASQKFVTFLRYSWLDGLHDGDKRVDGPLFDPELLFKTPEELQAFRLHADGIGSHD